MSRRTHLSKEAREVRDAVSESDDDSCPATPTPAQRQGHLSDEGASDEPPTKVADWRLDPHMLADIVSSSVTKALSGLRSDGPYVGPDKRRREVVVEDRQVRSGDASGAIVTSAEVHFGVDVNPPPPGCDEDLVDGGAAASSGTDFPQTSACPDQTPMVAPVGIFSCFPKYSFLYVYIVYWVFRFCRMQTCLRVMSCCKIGTLTLR